MSDRDADGRLGCEEFVLALYLCEMVVSGKPLLVELPLELIPPSFRKPVSRHGSVANSRHGSVSSQGNVSLHGDFDPALGMSQGKNIFETAKINLNFFLAQLHLKTNGKKIMTKGKLNSSDVARL